MLGCFTMQKASVGWKSWALGLEFIETDWLLVSSWDSIPTAMGIDFSMKQEGNIPHSIMCLLMYLMLICRMPMSVLGAGDLKMNKAGTLPSRNSLTSGKRKMEKGIFIYKRVHVTREMNIKIQEETEGVAICKPRYLLLWAIKDGLSLPPDNTKNKFVFGYSSHSYPLLYP